ncbi:NYN domain-containing protein [Nocardia blacklockiae]|uniref:NYN domain-containing protein n=1 Tax=Nocardia blacklockiae TaxID=480036 RepID=UPI00189376EF|nr:NYN domain-containing protein [Nocardia blacklockiae]MBF6172331.1 NYN domain-containing protein [Nocardia blacklockiae]
MDEGRLIVVDAANVVGSRPDGWWRDRAGAARRLLVRLAAAQWDEQVVVVLEGAAKAAVAVEDSFDSLRIELADGSGDDAIVDVVAAAEDAGQVTVVTADRGLRERVHTLGADTVGPRWLLERLEP